MRSIFLKKGPGLILKEYIMKSSKTLSWFRAIAIAEGISFLLLLGVAMPLKYAAGMPEAVKICGWIHGALFVSFLALALEVKSELNKNFAWLAKAFLAAILPFGTFVFDRGLKKDQQAAAGI
jgi:integral membrane protein